MSETTQSKNKRKFTGTVVSSNMDKTIVVRVDRTMVHPKYQKRYVRSKKYQVHDALNTHKAGDTVTFMECRPMSKNKRWRLAK